MRKFGSISMRTRSLTRFPNPVMLFQQQQQHYHKNMKIQINQRCFNKIQSRDFNFMNSKEEREELFIYYKKKLLLARGVIVKKRYLILDFPIGGQYIHSYTLSDLCGHGAFLFLAISYLENDFMNLRM